MESNGETKMNEAREKKEALLNASVFFFGAFFFIVIFHNHHHRLCQSFILISKRHYDIATYTYIEQSIIRLISIMCKSKNNSNARKLCN